MKNLIIVLPIWKIWFALQWSSLTCGFPGMIVAKSRGSVPFRSVSQDSQPFTCGCSLNTLPADGDQVTKMCLCFRMNMSIHVKNMFALKILSYFLVCILKQHNRQTLLNLFSTIFICKWHWPENGPCFWVAGWIYGGADHYLAFLGLVCVHWLGWLGLHMVQHPSALFTAVRSF